MLSIKKGGFLSAIVVTAALMAACGESATPASSSAAPASPSVAASSAAPASSAAASKPAASSAAPVASSSAPAAASASTAATASGSASGAPAASGASASAAPKPAAAPPPPVTAIAVKNDAKLGNFLVDGRGMTLYVFSADSKGAASTCVAGCAAIWPPAIASAAPTLPSGTAGALDLIARPDGPTKQASYNGLPLYFFASDTAAGDTKGDGVAGKWKVAAVGAA